ncbi:MAG TPA: MoaD/ThiS family protein [Longimicrobiaceae bacterium]|nr:MoaD/ThiS family protein [Longimicrobiaceae bacterium]
MIIRTLFFASYKDIAGSDALDIELPEGALVSDLVSQLRACGDCWNDLPASPVAAVNREYSPLSTSLAHGDEVAFIPPVSGG